MAKLVFKLRDVPEDEAQDVRELLYENNIEFYETHAGNWGIGMAGIWIKDNNRYAEAMTRIDQYQKERSDRFYQHYADLEDSGHAPSLFGNMRDNPLRFLVYIFSIAVILYISIIPFINV